MGQRRWVLITGASTGIGADAALQLARRGWRVFACVRKAEDGERLRSFSGGACPALFQERIEPVILDVTDHDQVAAAGEHIVGVTGDRGLTGLVNNAGIVVTGPLEALPIERFREQLDVNLTGLLDVTQVCVPMLRQASNAGGAPRIVNISSVNGSLTPPYMGPYGASKHGLEAISDAMRIELRRWRIHTALIKPGPVDTPIWDKAHRNAQEWAEELPPEIHELYADDIQALRAAVPKLADAAIPVERVTRQIVHALESRRPKARYYPTFDARISHKIVPLLPEWLRDFFVRRALGLQPK